MTAEELNEVRALKKRLIIKRQKLSSLMDSAEMITTKFTRDAKNRLALDVTPRSGSMESRLETFAVLIIDTEAESKELQERLNEAVPKLVEKIQGEVTDDVGRTLLIYRYVACKKFRDISFLMGYSLQHIYRMHKQLMEKLRVDKSPDSVIVLC